jgi:bifunctional non-homologous end joining protein LigD
MSLKKYREKRDFTVSPEPSGAERDSALPGHPLLYVVQKHRATQLHYDFRLEFNGVLLSWAVPKGPSLDPSVKRLAMQVEDHPVDYGHFEGVIPEGEYGGGTVMVWDIGRWSPEVPDVEGALRKGDLKFTLYGKKLRGSWVLVRTRGYGSKADKSWLLIKHRDEYASKVDIEEQEPRSAMSHRLLADIAREGGGDMDKAASGDPAAPSKPAARGKAKKLTATRKAKQGCAALAPPVSLCTSFSRFSIWSVFDTTAFTPKARARSSGIVSLCRVKRMIGTPGKIPFKTRAASRPFIRGMERSRMITSGRSSLAFSMA